MTRAVLRGLRVAAPALTVAVLVVATLVATGTAKADILRYAAYLGWGLLLPGTLVHRALRRRTVRLSEDLAGGVLVGMCLELPVFLALVATGTQWLLPWWPLAVVVPMLAVPRLRRCWRWGGEPGWTAGQSWGLAAITAAVIGWVAYDQWMKVPVRPSLSWWPRGADDIFHLALASELRNHVPPTVSWVAGEPLNYHWFHHAHLAASSDFSGVELRVVLLRLCLLPLIPAMIVLTAAAAARLSGKGWAGPAAAGLAFTVYNLPPLGRLFAESGPLVNSLYYSPGQTFGMAVQALTLLLLIDLFRGGARHAGTWVLLAGTVVVLAGSKSTFLPVLGAGLAFAFAVQLLRRRVHRALLASGVLVAVAVAGAVVVLFGGDARGLAFGPLTAVEYSRATRAVLPFHAISPTVLLLLTALAVATWCARFAGGVLALRRWDDPVVGVLAGSTAAAVLGLLLSSHPGGSEFYFIRGAMPLAAVLTVWGLATALERVAAPRRTTVLTTVAIVLGFVVATVVAWYTPLRWVQGRVGLRQMIVMPAIVLGGCIAGGVLLALLPGVRSRPRAAVALVLVAISATGLQRLYVDGRAAVDYAAANGMTHGWSGDPQALALTPWNVAAARWLRDHSSPDDVLATNVHCRVVRNGSCDNRTFIVTAFTERRVLVEGWGFTAPDDAALARKFTPYTALQYDNPFWDPARLAANDAAFTDPTPERLAELRDRWGVRWLFVSNRGSGAVPSPRLGQLADLRYENRDARVYRLRPAPTEDSPRANR
ncbi:MAG: hypothetical protein JWN54_3455 [Mycobacterium sp.]|nr:hypothetical protein [Mycobacterium sp.]